MIARSRPLRALTCAGFAFALIVSPAALAAQETPPGAASSPAAIEPIPRVEIPSRIERSRALVRRAGSLPSSEEVERIEQLLGGAMAEIESRARELERQLEAAPTSRALEDDQREWGRERTQQLSWQSTVESRWRRVQDLQLQLIRDQEVWSATIASVRGQEPDSELLRGLTDVLTEITTARTRLDQQLGALLALQTRIGAALDLINEALARIQGELDSAWLRLFERGGPPLWTAMLAQDDGPLLESLGETYRDSWWAISEYAGTALRPLMRHLILLAVFALVLRWVRPARDALPIEERPVGSAALDRPYSAAFLILILFTGTFYPNAPSAWNELLLLLAVLPLARTAFRALPETVHRPVKWTIALFAIYLLLTPSNSEALLTRLVLVLFTPIAIAVFVSVVYRLNDPDVGPWRRTVRLGMQLGAGLLTVSLLGAIFGWTALSWLLADATARSAYLAMLLATVGRVLIALVELLPDTPLSRYLRHLSTHRQRTTRVLRRLVVASVWFVWAYATLMSFGVIGPVTAAVTGALESAVTVGSITISLRSVLGVGAILVATSMVSRYVRFLLSEEVFSRRQTPPGESAALLTIVHYVVLGLGILMAGSAAGLTGTQLTVVAGALGVGIGFGLQAIVNNFVSGLILIFERPISVGDRVEVGTYNGIIERIGIRASVLRTYAGAEIVIPNADLITREVTNWTLTDQRRRVDVPVGVAYGSDTEKVLEIMERVARMEPLVVEEPAPIVLFRGFGDSSLNFMLFCWCNAADIFVAASQLSLAINREFAAAGISIPFPQRDLHLRSIDPGISIAAPVNRPDADGTAGD